MYSRFNFQTRLGPLEAEQTLVRLVRARGDAPVSRPFVGRVENGTFKFHRNIISRNSFLPVVTGRIVQGEGGAIVRGTMRLPFVAAAFTTMWIAIAITVVIDTWPRCLSNCDTSEALRAVLFPLFAVMLVTLGYYPGYHPERRKAMRIPQSAFAPGAMSGADVQSDAESRRQRPR